MNDFDTYAIEFMCRNCGETGTISIPKGTKLEDMSCPNCNCKTMSLYAKPNAFDVNENVCGSEDDSRLEGQ